MSTEPEGVQDLLEQDATMWEGDEVAEEEEHMQQDEQGAQTQANGKLGKRLPIPAPKLGAGQAASKAPNQGAQRQQQQPPRQQAGSAAGGAGRQQQQQRGGRQPHRYFILKSKSLFNVDQSVEKGIWATQVC